MAAATGNPTQEQTAPDGTAGMRNQEMQLPARLSVEQTAYLLGFELHDIRVLVAAKLLTPLGKPAQSAPKWFASVEIEDLARDLEFLSRATKAVSQRWRERNARVPKAKAAAQAA